MRQFHLLLVLCATATAQDLVLTPEYETGQTFQLQIAQTREDASHGLRETSSTIQTVTLTVRQAGPNGFRLEWAPGATTFDPPERAENPVVQASASALEGLTFQVLLEPDGSYVGIANEQELRAELDAALKTISDVLSENVTDEADRQTFREAFAEMLPPAAVLNSALRDVSLYFALSGLEFTLGETTNLESSEPGPEGTWDIRSRLQLSLLRRDRRAGEGYIALTQEFDPRGFHPMLEALVARVSQLADAAGEGVDLDSDVPEMSVIDTADYTADLSRRWIKQIRHKRTMSAGELISRVDTTTVTLAGTPN